MAQWRLPAWRKLLAQASHWRASAIPRRKVRLTWLAKLQGVSEADIDLLRELASNGEALASLTEHPAWAKLLEIKDELQAIATEQTRAPSSTDDQRRQGASAYWAIEGLFGAIYRTIANGQKATVAIREAVKSAE